MKSLSNCLYIVIPCYNEQEVLYSTADSIGEKMRALTSSGKTSANSRIVFVDDGSADNTWTIISELHNKSEIYCGVRLDSNVGHQNAVMAGLMYSKDKADIIITIDADLQDDPDAIDEMIEKYSQGFEVVCGVRRKRDKDSFFKRFTAEGYYKLLRLLGCKIIFNHADYRLMSARAVKHLSNYDERGLFLRGLVPGLGFNIATVEYDRTERLAGETKYTASKMLALASDGITSMSAKPVRIILTAGIVISIIAFLALIASLILLICGASASHFLIILSSIWLFGGLLLFAVGVVGEYVTKTLTESKRRPRYFIGSILD